MVEPQSLPDANGKPGPEITMQDWIVHLTLKVMIIKPTFEPHKSAIVLLCDRKFKNLMNDTLNAKLKHRGSGVSPETINSHNSSDLVSRSASHDHLS